MVEERILAVVHELKVQRRQQEEALKKQILALVQELSKITSCNDKATNLLIDIFIANIINTLMTYSKYSPNFKNIERIVRKKSLKPRSNSLIHSD